MHGKEFHGIFNYKAKNVLKKPNLAYKQENDGASHVHRLGVKPDNWITKPQGPGSLHGVHARHVSDPIVMDITGSAVLSLAHVVPHLSG